MRTPNWALRRRHRHHPRHTLIGLTNYTSYTVTLNDMLDSIPFLTDTMRVMPTDGAVYLPLVLKAYGRF